MDIESEVILLKAVNEHINDMVNHSLLEIRGKYPEQMIMFHDSPHRTLFFIRLVDFLSSTDAKGPLPKTIFLKGLADICSNPNFSINNSIFELTETVRLFRDWLNNTREIDIWLPSITKDITLKITMLEAIKMSGDISKHNYLRAIGVAEGFQKVLSRSGVNVDITTSLLALSDFQERFGDDVLIYLSSSICEFLNNIRLGIRAYLTYEFQRSYTPVNFGSLDAYEYNIPENIKSDYAKHCYWELMNQLRSKPYMPKFVICNSFKTEY